MTTMQIDRAVVEQALEALENVDGSITALRAALAQQDEPAQAGPRGQMITYWDSLTPWLIRAVERAHGIKE